MKSQITMVSRHTHTKLKFQENAHPSLKRLPSLEACTTEIGEWMSSNRLKLNANTTEFVWLGTRQHVNTSARQDAIQRLHWLEMLSTRHLTSQSWESSLTLKTHIKRLAGRCFYQFRHLRSVRNALYSDASKTLKQWSMHQFPVARHYRINII